MITQEQFQMMLNNRQYLNQQLAQFQQQAAQQLQQNSPQNIIQQNFQVEQCPKKISSVVECLQIKSWA